MLAFLVNSMGSDKSYAASFEKNDKTTSKAINRAEIHLRERENVYAFTEKQNRQLILPIEQDFQSYIPRWFIDQENALIYLIFDDTHSFKANIQIIGQMNGDGKKLYHISNSGRGRNKIFESSEMLKKEGRRISIASSFNDALKITNIAANITNQQTAIVLLGDGMLFINIDNISFYKSFTPSKNNNICTEYYKDIRPVTCKKINHKNVETLAKDSADSAFNAENYKLLTTCRQEHLSSGPNQKCSIPLQIGYTDETKAIIDQLATTSPYLSHYLFLESGFLELIKNGYSNDTFPYKYNETMVKKLYDKGLLKTRVYSNIEKRKNDSKFKSDWPSISLSILAFCVLTFLALGKRATFILSFGAAQFLYCLPVPEPYSGITVVNMGPYLGLAFRELPQLRLITILLFIGFVINWVFFHWLIIKIISIQKEK